MNANFSSIPAIGQYLVEVVVPYEQSFVELGLQVQSCSTGMNALRMRIEALFENFSSLDASAPLAQMLLSSQRRLQVLDELQKGLGEASQLLTSRQANMARLASACQHLSNQAHFFRVYSLNARIQAARIPGAEVLFASVIAATRRLGDDIYSVHDDVSDLIGNAITALGRSSSRCAHEMDAMRQSLRAGRVQLTQAEKAIRSLWESASAGLAHVRGNAHSVADQVSQLVVAVQFHDRLRQRIEHVQSALEQGCAHADEFAAEAELAPLLVLQAAQARAATGLVADVAGQTQRALAELERGLDAFVGPLAEKDVESLSHALATLENGLLSLEKIFSQSATIQSVIQETLADSERKAACVREKLQAILDWKMEAKLLSLNAIILAAALGPQGAGLGVISQEIVRQSAELHEIVERIVALANTQEQTVDLTAYAIQDLGGDELSPIRQLQRQLQDMHGSQRKREQTDLLKHIQLAKSATRLMDEMLERCEPALGQLEEWSDGLVQQYGRPQPGPNMLHLCAIYTMEEERFVHNTLFAGSCAVQLASGGDDDNVELF